MDETRALLDALMGPNRNKKESADGKAPDFVDRTVCKNFLVGFCPHDWFSMPKRQLMPCTRIHSELMRESFEKHPEVEKYRAWYEEDFLNYLQPVARDCDAYIMRERGKCRPKSSGGKTVRMPADVKERYDDMEKLYGDLIRKSEDAADESLAASKDLMGQAVVLKEELDAIKAKYTTEFQGEDICEVCGVKYPLGGGGAEWHDKESHKKGKTHQGYARIREKIDELLTKRKEWEKFRELRKKEYEPQKEREKENERPRERPAERPRLSDVDRDRERERQKDRDRAREREREKEREDCRERSRGRERPKHSEADRDRGREKEKERRAGDRGKERARSRRREAGKVRGNSQSRRQRTDSSSEKRSRSRRRKDRSKSKSGKSDRSSERSHSRNRKEKDQSIQHEKDKAKAKGGKSDRSSEPSCGRPRGDRGRKSSSQDRTEKPSEEGAKLGSSDEESQPEDEKDGITVADEDIPEFWARIQKLKGNVRNEAVAALSSATKERLEKWLLVRMRKKAAAA
mmetsp:Transcript_117446/g.292809  ORF Transcript_117446/g.292809 Transcript_117446/m.292809 type:complete len:516 (-) Transcript_117446:96-1643(-)|eukprot:CAMPEP_0115284074 /NCGR_PEP_ID=MMETSP0270-20121206/60707_1 /TAXON_ID=71861 /ORGANISM="Scrippsiella trochoidea, Strain CCMP3099" /LENGTH=515 /DNA_ID=CAMNT_0002701013 /DNA_START=57 /DNA_END=1604 /DNA_ORIENTATION=-